MIVRKLFIVCAILVSLFAFEGSLAYSMPREKARTEVSIRKSEQEKPLVISDCESLLPDFFEQKLSSKSQVFHPHFITLLTSSIYFHSQL